MDLYLEKEQRDRVAKPFAFVEAKIDLWLKSLELAWLSTH